jgi:hypothetical protein
MANPTVISPQQLGTKKDVQAATREKAKVPQAQALIARQPSGRAVARPDANSAFMARAARAQGQPVWPTDLDPETQRVVPYSETLKKQAAQEQQQGAERMARSPNGGLMPNGQRKILGVDAVQAQQQREKNDADNNAYMRAAGQKLREQRQTAAEQGRQQTVAERAATPAAPAAVSPEDFANRMVQPKGASAPAAAPASKGPGPGNTGYPGDGIYAMGKGNATMKNDYGTGSIEPATPTRTPTVPAPVVASTPQTGALAGPPVEARMPHSSAELAKAADVVAGAQKLVAAQRAPTVPVSAAQPPPAAVAAAPVAPAVPSVPVVPTVTPPSSVPKVMNTTTPAFAARTANLKAVADAQPGLNKVAGVVGTVANAAQKSKELVGAGLEGAQSGIRTGIGYAKQGADAIDSGVNAAATGVKNAAVQGVGAVKNWLTGDPAALAAAQQRLKPTPVQTPLADAQKKKKPEDDGGYGDNPENDDV